MGYKIESVSEWLSRTYNVEGTDLYECIKNNIAYREIDACLLYTSFDADKIIVDLSEAVC